MLYQVGFYCDGWVTLDEDWLSQATPIHRMPVSIRIKHPYSTMNFWDKLKKSVQVFISLMTPNQHGNKYNHTASELFNQKPYTPIKSLGVPSIISAESTTAQGTNQTCDVDVPGVDK